MDKQCRQQRQFATCILPYATERRNIPGNIDLKEEKFACGHQERTIDNTVAVLLAADMNLERVACLKPKNTMTHI